VVFSPLIGSAGRRYAPGALVITLACCVFAVIAHDVLHGSVMTGLDARLAQWFHVHATPGFTAAMLFITHADGLAGTSVMGALLAAWFWRRGLADWCVLTLVAVPGGMLLNVLLKHWFQRARPRFDDPLLTLATYSFPSGHTAAATVLYGLLACFLVRRLRAWPARALALAGAAAMVALVALSRLYLGVHFLSDVLAAVAESCAWLAACLTGLFIWQRRHGAAGAGA